MSWEENLKSDEWWKSNVETLLELILTLNKYLDKMVPFLQTLFLGNLKILIIMKSDTVDVGC